MTARERIESYLRLGERVTTRLGQTTFANNCRMPESHPEPVIHLAEPRPAPRCHSIARLSD